METEESRPLGVASVVESPGRHNFDYPRPRPGEHEIRQPGAVRGDDDLGLVDQPGLLGQRIVFHRVGFESAGVQQLLELLFIGERARAGLAAADEDPPRRRDRAVGTAAPRASSGQTRASKWATETTARSARRPPDSSLQCG